MIWNLAFLTTIIHLIENQLLLLRHLESHNTLKFHIKEMTVDTEYLKTVTTWKEYKLVRTLKELVDRD